MRIPDLSFFTLKRSHSPISVASASLSPLQQDDLRKWIADYLDERNLVPYDQLEVVADKRSCVSKVWNKQQYLANSKVLPLNLRAHAAVVPKRECTQIQLK